MAELASPALPAPILYPSPSEAALKSYFVGRQVKDVQAPAAIIDVAVVKRNCEYMLEAAEKLGVGFRAHVKTHKVDCNSPMESIYADSFVDNANNETASW